MEGFHRLGWGVGLPALLCALALTIPSPALAQTARPAFKVGTYAGTTSQGLPITFTVSRNAVLSIDFGWRARCADGRKHVNTISGGGGRIRHRRFYWGAIMSSTPAAPSG